MLCPKCHTQNRENARFCKGCGLSFTPEMLAAATQPVAAEGAVENRQEQNAPSTSVQSAQEQAQSAPASSSQGAQAPVANQVSAAPMSSANQVDDITQAPTQILTPQQMIAYHAKRWQQELEREKQEQQSSDAEQGKIDIADAPTKLFATSATQNPPPTQDVAEMPTALIQPNGSNRPASVPPPPPPESLVSAANAASEFPAEASERATPASITSQSADARADATNAAATDTSSTTAAETPANDDAATSQEDAMERVTNSSGDQSEHDQAEKQEQPVDQSIQPGQATDTTQTAFPTLAVGTTVAERYEVAQVISDTEDEHVYLVTDHQGYQRCWNCGSEENTEGDEFCTVCGAELLNASYTMHEYPAAESKDNEAHVLQGVIVNTFVEQGHTYVIEQPQAEQNAFPNGVHLLVASDSDAGNVRRSEPNEDSTLVLQLQRIHESLASPVGVFIVADGMGGHANGQGASRMTISMIAERMVRELLEAPLATEKSGEKPEQLDEDRLVALLNGAVEDANTALCQENQREKSDMGSTITGFMVIGDHAYILNVGDSRSYMLREGKLHQLTNDHSLVGQLVAGGLIEPDDVYTHPQRSQIYRSLGDKLNVQIDIFKQQIYPGDILLSCCDGLWEMIRNPQITEILSHAPDPQTACSQLIETANMNGGEDNISAVVVFMR